MEDNPQISQIISIMLGQMNSALKISDTISQHLNEEKISGDSIIIGLIYRLMTPLTTEESLQSIDQGNQLLDSIFNSEESDEESNEESDEEFNNESIIPDTYHPLKCIHCNCDICMKSRISILNYKNYESKDPLTDMFHNAIQKTCQKYKISL